MKKMIVCGLAGLMSVGLIAGCGMMRNTRDDCSNGRCRHGLAQQSNGGWWAKNQGPAVGTESVVIGETTTEPAPTKATPTRATPTKAVPTLPDIPAIPRIEAPPREKKIDHIEEENAIINREIAGIGSGGVMPATIPSGRSDVQLIDRTTEAVALPMVTVEKPMTAAPLPKGPEVVVTPEVIVQTPERIIADNGKEKTVALKSMHIHYGQTDNFTVITGQLQEYRKSLRLRYAAIDQDDPYGGVVVLEGGQELRQLRDGQHVRVRGVLVPPETRTASATYRVKAVEVLD